MDRSEGLVAADCWREGSVLVGVVCGEFETSDGRVFRTCRRDELVVVAHHRVVDERVRDHLDLLPVESQGPAEEQPVTSRSHGGSLFEWKE